MAIHESRSININVTKVFVISVHLAVFFFSFLSSWFEARNQEIGSLWTVHGNYLR